MKFYALAALGAVAYTKESEMEAELKLEKEEKLKLQFEGAKAFYDGYYKSFYKVKKVDENTEKCLNDATIDNMIALEEIVVNPLQMFELKNIKDDMNLFGEFAEVAGDLSNCHFEKSFFDLYNMCKEEKDICAMP